MFDKANTDKQLILFIIPQFLIIHTTDYFFLLLRRHMMLSFFPLFSFFGPISSFIGGSFRFTFTIVITWFKECEHEITRCALLPVYFDSSY